MSTFNCGILNDIQWPIESLMYVGRVHEFRGRQKWYFSQKKGQLKRMTDLAQEQNIIYTCINDNFDITEAKIKHIVQGNGAISNEEEAIVAGYSKLLSTVTAKYKNVAITPNNILKFHEYLLQYDEQYDNGKFRTDTDYLLGDKVSDYAASIFPTLENLNIEATMTELCNSYNEEIQKNEIDPILLVAYFIQELIIIKPFRRGNWQIISLLFLLLLNQNKYFIGNYFSLEKEIKSTRTFFDRSLQKTLILSDNQSTADFINYLLCLLIMSYIDFEKKLRTNDNKLTTKDLVTEEIKNLNSDTFTKKKIIELCPSISKPSIEVAIKTLCDTNKIVKEGVGRGTYYRKLNI